jgi:hypothetical protein
MLRWTSEGATGRSAASFGGERRFQGKKVKSSQSPSIPTKALPAHRLNVV